MSQSAPEAGGEIPPASQRGAVVPGLRNEKRGTSARATREGAAVKGDGEAGGAPEASGETPYCAR